MTAPTLTLTLSEPIWRYLNQIALATQQPLEQVVRQSVEGNLPPAVDTAPTEMQSQLLAMQTLSLEALRQVALSQIPLPQQERHFALLERNQEEGLSPAESQELAELRLEADRLTVRKAYAWAVLRWRGQPIPTLNELPLNEGE